MTVRVALLDDHRAFGEALSVALAGFRQIEAVGVASSVAELVESFPSMKPDVLVSGFQLRDGSAIDCARQLAQNGHHCRLILLTAYDGPHVQQLAIGGGFEQILSKEVAVAEVAHAISVPPAEPVAYHDDPQRVALSPRQYEVLELMGQGLDPARIADKLVISLHTARGHVKAVLQAFNAPSQLAVVTTAIRDGYLLPPSRTRSGEGRTF